MTANIHLARQTHRCRGLAAYTKALGTCGVTETHKGFCAKFHTLARLCVYDCPVGIRLLSFSAHTHQSNLCSSEDISLCWTWLDGRVGHESLTTTSHDSGPELLPLEPSRLETRSEESCLLGDSWLGVGQTAGGCPLPAEWSNLRAWWLPAYVHGESRSSTQAGCRPQLYRQVRLAVCAGGEPRPPPLREPRQLRDLESAGPGF